MEEMKQKKGSEKKFHYTCPQCGRTREIPAGVYYGVPCECWSGNTHTALNDSPIISTIDSNTVIDNPNKKKKRVKQ
jgi:hypothetical protein